MITRRFFPVAFTSSVMWLAGNALGADMLPQPRIDASGTGTVPTAVPLKSGFSKATLHGESQVAPSEGGESSNYRGIDRVTRFDAVAGTSLVEGLDLHLGLHGTYERDEEESSRRVSGASVMLKTNVINASGFNLALAPHLESGIGTKDKGDFSRAAGVRGGLMIILGFNRKNVVEWNLALGNRNRAPEEYRDLRIGHELLYKSSLKVHVTDSLGFTVAADGRQIRAEEGPVATGRGQAGIFAKFGRFETSVYGGSSIDRPLGKVWKPSWKVQDLDGGRFYVGAALSMSLGSTRSYGIDDVQPARTAPAQPVPGTSPEDRNETDGNSTNQSGTEPSYDTDFLKDYERASSPTRGDETKDDFAAAESSMKRRATEKAPVYDIESVEREIERLRDADKKAEEARQKAEEARLEKERRTNAKNAATRAKQMERMRKDVQSEVDALPTITTEDMSWSGLE